jgi:glutamyl-tRNA synthetase
MSIFDFLKTSGKKIRTRLAPSPTGPLHIGTARTALFNYIFAMQNNGDFILRVEDTDAQRSDKRFEEDIVNGLKWLGINHNEFYRQSERTKLYKEYLKKLLDKKNAFWCYHTKEELAEEKKRQMQNKEAPRHMCGHKSQNQHGKGIIRLKGTNKKIKFRDLVRGDIEYKGSLLGDIAIAKNEETPLYNFAVVIDDYDMKISHIIRGEDHIPNTPKQILIQESLGIKAPRYVHLPMILGSDKSKLSKRHGATSINEYKRMGYLADAIINFMALLGWNPGDDKEIFSREELMKAFSFEKIQKAGAIFSIDKLNWFNKEYIKKKSAKSLSQEIMEFVPQEWQAKIKNNPSYWRKIIELEKPRLTRLSETKENVEYFFDKPNFPKSLLVWKSTGADREEGFDKTVQYLDKLITLLSNLESAGFMREDVKKIVWNYAEEKGRGNVLWPFRVALTGKAKSPDPFSIAEILGKEETMKRLEYAKNMIYGNPVVYS